MVRLRMKLRRDKSGYRKKQILNFILRNMEIVP
jgi:hypothetical protein